ncbi:MAG: DUF2007 domain-containing protein [Oscillospiraceae bacterium]
MFCPKCKSEYIEGYTHCKKCDVDLVEQLPDEPHEHKVKDTCDHLPSIDLVAVKYVSNAIDAEMMMEILRNNGIPCFRKSREAGGYLSISAGFSVFGEDIYVDRKNAQAALDLLDDWDENRAPTQEEFDEHYGNAPAYNRRRAAARVFSIFFAAASIIGLIVSAIFLLKSLLLN